MSDHFPRASVAGPGEFNPGSLAEWEGQSEVEYAASLRDVPDEVLDAAPPDLPEDVWLALAEAEAAQFSDALPMPPGRCWPRRCPGSPTARLVMGG